MPYLFCSDLTISLARGNSHDLNHSVLVVTGVVNGATGSQIMPILPYLLSLQLERNLLVQTMNSSFTFSTFIMILGLGKMGFITWPIVMTSLIGILPVALGIGFGGMVRKRVTEETYRRCVLMLLIILGLGLIGRSWV